MGRSTSTRTFCRRKSSPPGEVLPPSHREQRNLTTSEASEAVSATRGQSRGRRSARLCSSAASLARSSNSADRPGGSCPVSVPPQFTKIIFVGRLCAKAVTPGLGGVWPRPAAVWRPERAQRQPDAVRSGDNELALLHIAIVARWRDEIRAAAGLINCTSASGRRRGSGSHSRVSHLQVVVETPFTRTQRFAFADW